ncbi:MAG: transposase [Bacteroidetes bacterium]|nr:transposase [Bacteroidota bacterium]
MTISIEEFVRRFEQHILPKGLTKIRSYGYLSNKGRTKRIKQIIALMKLPPHPQK